MAKYYDDYLAAAEKDISSRNFCNLVDAAVKLYEEEQSSLLLLEKAESKFHTRILSEEEEESDKRIFHLFPRKRRGSLATIRNPEQSHQNLNGASTSSEENMCNLGDAAARSYGDKNLKEDEEEEEETDKRNFHLFLRKQRTWVEKPVPQENLNGASTSCKRRAPQERKRSGGKAKKAKVAPFSWKERATPECLTQMMNHMKGPQGLYEITQGPRLIFEKKLTKSDVDPAQSRFLIPLRTLIRYDFLTPVELGIIADLGIIAEEDDKEGVGAVLVDQQNIKWGLMFVAWNMKKKSGNVSFNYAFNCGWNDIVKGNGLKEDDDISIWSFRCQQVLCFALVLPPSPDMAT